jgi:hypothetical protein
MFIKIVKKSLFEVVYLMLFGLWPLKFKKKLA